MRARNHAAEHVTPPMTISIHDYGTSSPRVMASSRISRHLDKKPTPQLGGQEAIEGGIEVRSAACYSAISATVSLIGSSQVRSSCTYGVSQGSTGYTSTTASMRNTKGRFRHLTSVGEGYCLGVDG